MEADDPKPAASTEPDGSSAEVLDALRADCRVDHERLLAMALSADSFLNAARVVNNARDHAEQLVATARRHADRVRDDAARDAERIRDDAEHEAEAIVADARRQRDLLRSEIEQLQAERARAQAAEPESDHTAHVLRVEQWQTRALAEAASSTASVPETISGDNVHPTASRGTLPDAGPAAPGAIDESEDDLIPSASALRADFFSSKDATGADASVEPVGSAPGARPRVGRTAAIVIATVAVLVAVAAWMLRDREVARRTPIRAAAPASPSKTATAAGVPSDAPTAPAAARPAGVSVVFETTRKAWVRAGADGSLDRGGFVDAGTHRELVGMRHVDVGTADAGALLVSVNGGPAAPLGDNGVEVSKRWTSSEPDLRAGTQAAAQRLDSVATSGINPASGPLGESARQQIVDAERYWFDAFYRGDAQAMRALQVTEFEAADARPAGDRPVPGAGTERIVEALTIDASDDKAVISGRMTERPLAGRAVTSYFAETWIRRDGRWQMKSLRLNTPAQISSSAKP